MNQLYEFNPMLFIPLKAMLSLSLYLFIYFSKKNPTITLV